MWIYPTRGRPAACEALLASMVAHGMQAPGLLMLSANDPHRAEYEALTLPASWERCIVQMDGVDTAEKMRLAFGCRPNEPWYGWIADDNTIRTDGFERRLVAAAGSWGMASANDLWQSNADPDKSRCHGATVFGGALLRALGWIVPPGFEHAYIDDVWEKVGRDLGVWRILMDVVTPHHWHDKDPVTAQAFTTIKDGRGVLAKWLEAADAEIHRVRMQMWEARGLSVDAAKGRSVLIGTPCYRDCSPGYTAAIIETVTLLMTLGIRCEVRMPVGVTVHQARNAIANAFLETNHTDLLFIDADMSWDAWDVVKLLASDKELIGGVGRKKSHKPDNDLDVWCFAGIEGSEDSVQMDAAGNLMVASVGTGFLKIRRNVFEELMAAHPEWRRRSNVTDNPDAQRWYWRFFAWGDTGLDEIGEDYEFCRRWRDLGGSVWVDPSIRLKHFGIHTYGGCIGALFEAA